jgi:hypothetical protein
VETPAAYDRPRFPQLGGKVGGEKLLALRCPGSPSSEKQLPAAEGDTMTSVDASRSSAPKLAAQPRWGWG